jgi:hypothetical protein
MTKLPINYSNTVIYKIVCNDLSITDVYVGSTTDFIKRKYHHKSDCNNKNSKNYNEKKYIVIRANNGWDSWSMIEIEKFPCNDNNEARARERYWYELINANMNSVSPFITKDEKTKQNLEQSKKYYELNKSVVNKKHKNYYALNKKEINEKSICLCGVCYTNANKYNHLKTKKHISYLEENKETII